MLIICELIYHSAHQWPCGLRHALVEERQSEEECCVFYPQAALNSLESYVELDSAYVEVDSTSVFHRQVLCRGGLFLYLILPSKAIIALLIRPLDYERLTTIIQKVINR
ncbi:hypothetical protein AVEN_57250-1 [Araneus ventricosus]|uniref:Uncharacterized protein n=1 Tax=Araneus ventricosus TaxID=182803 RepID=A0A4Y2SJ07_ARAVE|nr:hypothetical protein AVEN_57250-1 [Araneus ventricosus]